MSEIKLKPCPFCDSTVIFLKKCEPEGVGHD